MRTDFSSAEAFLAAILAIPSVNGVNSEHALAEFLCAFFRDCGLSPELQKVADDRANVIVRIDGRSRETVIWNGHLDTVPYGNLDEWRTDPSIPVKRDGRLYARGASDMKSGLAGMAWTLAAMKQAGMTPERTILFCGTCDEEKGGQGAAAFLRSPYYEKPSLLLIGEPTSLRLGMAQKGCIWLRLRVQGKTAHGAYPEEGVNAVTCGIELYETIRKSLEQERHPLLGHGTVQLTQIQGGIVPNMTPDRAELVLDIRTLPGTSAEDVIGLVRREAERLERLGASGAHVEIEILNQRAAIELSRDSPWIKIFAGELAKEGVQAEPLGINFFTDASILAAGQPDIPVLLFGPGEPSMAHKPNEYVDLSAYERYIRILWNIGKY